MSNFDLLVTAFNPAPPLPAADDDFGGFVAAPFYSPSHSSSATPCSLLPTPSSSPTTRSPSAFSLFTSRLTAMAGSYMPCKQDLQDEGVMLLEGEGMVEPVSARQDGVKGARKVGRSVLEKKAVVARKTEKEKEEEVVEKGVMKAEEARKAEEAVDVERKEEEKVEVPVQTEVEARAEAEVEVQQEEVENAWNGVVHPISMVVNTSWNQVHSLMAVEENVWAG